MVLELPESVAAMVADTKLLDGVTELVEKLNGKKMIADDWKESRDYAHALTMAAVARGEFVVFAHDFWDKIWLKAGVTEFGEDIFDIDVNPNYIWDHEEIYRHIQTNVQNSPRITFYLEISLNDGEAWLIVESYDNNDEQIACPFSVNGWHEKRDDDDDFPSLKSSTIKLTNLAHGVETLRNEATAMVAAIKSAQ